MKSPSRFRSSPADRLASEMPELTDRLHGELKSWWQDVGARSPTATRPCREPAMTISKPEDLTRVAT